jgi:hypothetical protein
MNKHLPDAPPPWRVIIVGNTIKSHAIVDANGKKVCGGISPKTNIAEQIVRCINLLCWPVNERGEAEPHE